MKASDMRPATMSAAGAPAKALGTGARARRVRMPAKSTSTSPKPNAAPKPYSAEVRKSCAFCTLMSATPSTAQFVVISGRKIPSA